MSTSRRQFLSLLCATSLTSIAPVKLIAQQTMPTRTIPSTGEQLPVIGLGSSKVVAQIGTKGTEPLEAVLRTLVAHGGKVVDTWPRVPANDEGFGRVIAEPDLVDSLFITSKIDRPGKQAGIDQFRQTQRLYGRQQLDLVQVFSLTDVETHWPSLLQWKEEGLARYIGVTVADRRRHGQLEEFLLKHKPDFVQMNYSLSERQAEQKLLPMAADKGIAVLINRPFMNGTYFRALQDRPLPQWTEEFACESWAQFSLKYILANPAVTCVLAETTNPLHMAENARAASGGLPDAGLRERMKRTIDEL